MNSNIQEGELGPEVIKSKLSALAFFNGYLSPRQGTKVAELQQQFVFSPLHTSLINHHIETSPRPEHKCKIVQEELKATSGARIWIVGGPPENWMGQLK